MSEQKMTNEALADVVQRASDFFREEGYISYVEELEQAAAALRARAVPEDTEMLDWMITKGATVGRAGMLNDMWLVRGFFQLDPKETPRAAIRDAMLAASQPAP